MRVPWFKVLEFKCVSRLNDTKIYRPQSRMVLLAFVKALSPLQVLPDMEYNPRGYSMILYTCIGV
jgi:hypothetical protein